MKYFLGCMPEYSQRIKTEIEFKIVKGNLVFDDYLIFIFDTECGICSITNKEFYKLVESKDCEYSLARGKLCCSKLISFSGNPNLLGVFDNCFVFLTDVDVLRLHLFIIDRFGLQVIVDRLGDSVGSVKFEVDLKKNCITNIISHKVNFMNVTDITERNKVYLATIARMPSNSVKFIQNFADMKKFMKIMMLCN